MPTANAHVRGGGAIHRPTKQSSPRKSYEQQKFDSFERAMCVLGLVDTWRATQEEIRLP